MAQRKTAEKKETDVKKASVSDFYTVNVYKLKLRATPSRDGEIITVLPRGLKIAADKERTAPDGWIAVDGIGYVMADFLM